MVVDAVDLPADRDAAVSALFAVHHRRLVGLARLLVDDLAAAEDVVQDAFATLYRRWPWLRDHNAAVSYLQTAVVNGSRTQLRRRRVARRVTPLRGPDLAPSAETTTLKHQEEELLQRCVAALPFRQRQVVVLRYYCGMSEAEIADTLSVSRGSVKQHASRALTTLQSHLEAHMEASQ